MKTNFENNNQAEDATVERCVKQALESVTQNAEEKKEEGKKEATECFELPPAVKEEINSLINRINEIGKKHNIPMLLMVQTRNGKDSYGLHIAQIRAGAREVSEFHLIHEIVERMFNSEDPVMAKKMVLGLPMLLMGLDHADNPPEAMVIAEAFLKLLMGTDL